LFLRHPDALDQAETPPAAFVARRGAFVTQIAAFVALVLARRAGPQNGFTSTAIQRNFTMIRTLVAASLLTLSASAFAHPALDAIAAADKKALQTMHHRQVETSVGNAGTRKIVSSFNPSAPADTRWTLESIDGRAPSGTELAEFRKKKNDAVGITLGDLLDPNSFKPLDNARQPRRWGFRFKPGKQIKGLDMSKFDGIVTLGEAGEPTAIDMMLKESVRMKLVIKVSRLNFHTEYARMANGDVVVRSSDVLFDASAAIHSFNQKTHTSYEMIKSGSGS
jgi:hypothetical protein